MSLRSLTAAGAHAVTRGFLADARANNRLGASGPVRQDIVDRIYARLGVDGDSAFARRNQPIVDEIIRSERASLRYGRGLEDGSASAVNAAVPCSDAPLARRGNPYTYGVIVQTADPLGNTTGRTYATVSSTTALDRQQIVDTARGSARPGQYGHFASDYITAEMGVVVNVTIIYGQARC